MRRASDAQAGGWSPALVLVLVVVLLAGALFGYDQGVISGALEGVQRDFKLSPLLVEVVTSWVTLGALVGLARRRRARRSRSAGARRCSRAAVLFAAGAAVEALAPGVAILVAGRLLVGFGVGVAAVAAPLYAAELAPAAQRGRFVSAYQLAITIGIFLVVPHRPGAGRRPRVADHARRIGGARRSCCWSRCCRRSNRRAGWCASGGATSRARRSCARGRGSIPTCA